jgi:hypothetical protein
MAPVPIKTHKPFFCHNIYLIYLINSAENNSTDAYFNFDLIRGTFSNLKREEKKKREKRKKEQPSLSPIIHACFEEKEQSRILRLETNTSSKEAC